MVHTLQVTLAGKTQILAAVANGMDMLAKQATFQNNGTHDMRIGDSTITSSIGIVLQSGGGGGNFGPFTVQDVDLTKMFAIGTDGDVIDVIYFD